MKEVIAVVIDGHVQLPSFVHIPDGTTVRISWTEKEEEPSGPYDREALESDDVAADLDWASGRRRLHIDASLIEKAIAALGET